MTIPSRRAAVYRTVFALAALYNTAFGLWAVLRPLAFFRLFEMEPPRYPEIWRCLGMVLGLYGLGYAYAARHLDRARPWIAIGLAGKILGPLGWAVAVGEGAWPWRTFLLIAFNDLVWWVPFGLFLLDGTRAGTRFRAAAPEACAGLNALAGAVMLFFLRPGMEVVADPAARAAYIARNPVTWRVGWGLWIAAAVSLLAFYAWWGCRLASWTRATIAFLLAVAGIACDVAAESLYIGWLPERLETVGPLGTLLTGAGANGFYTAAGILLTRATPAARGGLRFWAWVVWTSGGALTAFTLAGFVPGMVASTAVLMTVFPPWVIALGWRLRHESRGEDADASP